jgi:hypothetical protein
MTHRILIGIDPGLTGALAVLHDGGTPVFFDMPLMRKRVKGKQVNAGMLAVLLRGIRGRNPGASFLAVVEEVGTHKGEGPVGAMSFGRTVGVIDGVLATLDVPAITVTPQIWKKSLNLMRKRGESSRDTKSERKDEARALALKLYPECSYELALKKHGGRADALLIATWAHRSEVTA